MSRHSKSVRGMAVLEATLGLIIVVPALFILVTIAEWATTRHQIDAILHDAATRVRTVPYDLATTTGRAKFMRALMLELDSSLVESGLGWRYRRSVCVGFVEAGMDRGSGCDGHRGSVMRSADNAGQIFREQVTPPRIGSGMGLATVAIEVDAPQLIGNEVFAPHGRVETFMVEGGTVQ